MEYVRMRVMYRAYFCGSYVFAVHKFRNNLIFDGVILFPQGIPPSCNFSGTETVTTKKSSGQFPAGRRYLIECTRRIPFKKHSF